jgi:hypothetical protein
MDFRPGSRDVWSTQLRLRGVASHRPLRWIAISAVPVIWLEGVRLVAGAPVAWSELAVRWAFVAGLLVVSRWTQPHAISETAFVWPWPGVLALAIGGGAALLYIVRGTTWAAWIALSALYLLLLGLEGGLSSRGNTFWRWGARGLLVLLGGAIPVSIVQVESRFAEEEFFVALQALVMVIFWVLLLVARRLLVGREPRPNQPGLRLDRRWTGLSLFLLTLIGLGATVRAYQHSFYPPVAPAYEGISPQNPFLCGEALSDPEPSDGTEVFRRILARVEANPHSGPPEYGMLALGTGEYRWAQAFRKSILEEATAGRFTESAGSVKWTQYAAALRAYYLPRVRATFPDLFSAGDWTQMQSWFAAINRRALTVESVDWMYALAFSKWPEGPYENQENGAGLLALLEVEGLAAPDLSPLNRDYLERSRRGWLTRFRNTDDAFVYQPEWIHNAYFQSLYTGQAPEDSVRRSFEWLLLQALSDGAPLRYNHPDYPSLAGIAYLGARLLDDPRYVWLAGRALDYAEAQGGYLFAQPGVEQPLALPGQSPTQGSCLLYGDSGLPNQEGPLAPDKIVFRGDWLEESAYLLLNLRFTGWHRYKATNTVTLVHQGAPLASDLLEGKPSRWLPEGRSVFRDKRIPRENLNGLLITRSGMSAVLYYLSGIGGPWAQDPPYYAEVLTFETGDERDWSHTRLTDWRDWQHDRWIYFYHDQGPVIVVDAADGPPAGQAALAWHLAAGGTVEGQHIRLNTGEQPAEVVFLPTASSGGSPDLVPEPAGAAGQRVVYYGPFDGHLRAMTVFLLGRWVGAEVTFHEEGQSLRVVQGGAQITLPMPFGE